MANTQNTSSAQPTEQVTGDLTSSQGEPASQNSGDSGDFNPVVEELTPETKAALQEGDRYNATITDLK